MQSSSPEQRQREAEQAARDLALGRRASQILSGDAGPVLRKWVAATIGPVAARVREACELIDQRKHTELASLMDSPVFGGLEIAGNTGDLHILSRWARIGRSPGRAELDKTTHCEDMVLTVLGTALTLIMRGNGATLNTAIMQAARALRECCVGQFISEVQGGAALRRMRTRKQAWRASADFAQVARLMAGQVRTKLEEGLGFENDGERAVLWVSIDGVERRLDLRPQEPEDWELIELCAKHIGEPDHKIRGFIAFTLLILCATQREFGWFDISEGERKKGRRGGYKRPRMLTLSAKAANLIERDAVKWAQAGFVKEPMRVPAVEGDYLTVKHRVVASRPGPKGWVTHADKSWQWEAVRQLGEVPWRVNTDYLRSLKATQSRDALTGTIGEASNLADQTGLSNSLIGSYSRLATEPALYFPVFMDFRGRTYLRPSQVTYQGSDLQKALLVMPERSLRGEQLSKPSIMHFASLAGLDKAPWPEREAWWRSGDWTELETPDEPHQFEAWKRWITADKPDYTPCVQLDGTCNGLQHLSALFRDPVSAEAVNLTPATDDTAPQDIYGRVANKVQAILNSEPNKPEWMLRVLHHVRIDRSLVKRSVMTLPYGATRYSVREFIHDKAAEEADAAAVKAYQSGWCSVDGIAPWTDWQTGKYQAFKDRELKDHPLFRLDMDRLGDIVWDAITETLPLPIRAMESWRRIGGWVGERILAWSPHEFDRSGVGLIRSPSIHVIQARSKAALRPLKMKGLHLPDSVRQVAAVWGRDEIDRTYQRSGIVANYIHSMDATHLALTVHDCLQGRGLPTFTPLGTIHDCFLTMPRHADTLGKILRHTWCELYEDDPLSRVSVALYDPDHKGKDALVWAGSWRQAAEEAGLPFPERGDYEVNSILSSAWAFS